MANTGQSDAESQMDLSASPVPVFCSHSIWHC